MKINLNKNPRQIIYRFSSMFEQFAMGELSKRRNNSFKFVCTIENEWSLERKREYIISIIMGYYAGRIIFYRNKDNKFIVLDGNNRAKAIQQFVDGEFSIQLNGKEIFFTDIQEVLKQTNNEVEVVEIVVDTNDKKMKKMVLTNYLIMYHNGEEKRINDILSMI